MAEYIVDFYSERDGVRCEKVVRCKDCVYFQRSVFDDGEHSHWCFLHGTDYAEPVGFCKWGKEIKED